MNGCMLCPRQCQIKREEGKRGFCGESDLVRLSRAALHMWEEPCISGTNGSGAVFFSGCTLRCVYCQNYHIANSEVGKTVSVERLSEIFLELQEQGANNINLVTPTHFVPQIIAALDQARKKGLNLPIVYNTSGYEKVETLRRLNGYVDVYLPDFKYLDPEHAKKYSGAEDYPEVAKAALEEMRQKRNDLRKSIEEEKAALQELFIKQNTARMNVVTAQERKAEAEQGYGDLKSEELEIDRKQEQINQDKEAINQELQISQEQEKNLEQAIAQCQKELDGYRAEESGKTSMVGEWDVAYEKLLQKQEFEKANLSRIESEIDRLNRELQEVELSLSQSQEEADVRRKSIEELSAAIEASHTTQSDSEVALKEKQTLREELTAKQKTFFSTREELSDRKAGLDKEVYRLNAQKEKLDDMLDSQINYMWNEYELTLSSAAELRKEDMTDVPAMRKQIAGIKDELRKLGDVNVNAIEDYKALMERYTFLKNQHDDLIEAEKTLEGIIQELDTAMRKQFAEKFEEIRREFDKVFKELFGGGKGTLELIEDEDILEAGVRIIAQPPGKKLQNMMQLSGGEKSFTAIALLFAIQSLKPSPFCLLDEIEAALDEGNVSRFAKYLNKLTKSTQFIVITHRRGTMEQADRLYGITMQEKGVSTLVSVNLIDSSLEN